MPIFLRGGQIVARKDRLRRASSIMKRDPYTVIVALSSPGTAQGRIYIDDGSSYNYKNGDYINAILEFKENRLTSKLVPLETPINIQGTYNLNLERIIVVGLHKKPTIITNGYDSIDFTIKSDGKLFKAILKKPSVNFGDNWSIDFKFE